MRQNTDQPSSKFNLLRLWLLICTTLVSTLSFAQAGNAPMQTLPSFPGNFAIDGFLQRQGVNGDWLPAAGGSANNFVMNNAGVPVVPLGYHLIDLFNDQVSDDIFDGGNKLFQNPNVWGWRSQKPPGKDDINNATAFLALNPANSHIWCAISGDRMETNGTSYLDFEFYQNTITKNGGPTTGGFTSTGPHNGRTVGDLSLTLQFTQGGSFASIFYLQWQPGAEAGTYDYFEITPVGGSAFAAANGGVADINVPYGAFGGTTYSTLQFVEGAVDMTALIGGTGLPGECGSLPFKSLFIKTKSSAETTADLKDFIAPLQIQACFDRTNPTISCPNTLNLGCNPTIPGPSGATASDNCDGVIIPVASDGPVQSTGCSRTMVRTWRAQDQCGNTASCGQIINWTADNTAPSITTGGTGPNLGCNPSAGDINNALGTASASDACGAPTISQSDGSVSSNGCGRSQTRTWTARDGCGNTSTASRTATWTADNTAPTVTANGTGTSLGCNPAASDINLALGSASATDACGPTTVTQNDGPVNSDGCSRSQTRTFTARDGCGNTATTSRTANWIADVTPPTIQTGGTTTNLGCNPAASDINNALGTATSTDACGTTTTTPNDGPVNSTGCSRSQTRTWTARDGCGNTATASRTVNWTADQTPPTFTGSFATIPLGCNPAASDISGALGSASATDACGPTTVTQSDGPINSDGCGRSQTRTFTAKDGCNNTATASRTVTWTADNTPPTFIGNFAPVNLGCNPVATDVSGSLGTASATDACGAVTITQSDGAVTTTACGNSQTRTFTARDGCGNTATVSRTVNWGADQTPPQFTGSYASVPLGCNPAASDITGALDGATATDACGPTTVTNSDGPVNSDGCSRSQTRTFTAKDGCNNTATISRTVTWTADVTPPGFTGSYATVALGCNPAASDITAALDGSTATDACGPTTTTQSDGPVGSTGCGRSQTRTFTARDGCGNTATISRTVTWTADQTPPTFTGSYTSIPLGCNPAASDITGALGSASATDACGPTTVTQSDGSVSSDGCSRSQTRTFTAKDGCNNTATTSRTVTWTADVTPPVFTGSYATVTLGCNPAASDISAALDGSTATDACGPTTTTQSDGAVGSTGCSRSQTRTFTARDGCGNTATVSRTVNWTADQTPPTFTGSYTSIPLGCNPAASDISGALGSASATDACGPTTVTQSDGSVSSDGCSRSQTRTFTARDGCGNTATASRTVTWTADVTPPVFTGNYATTPLGCNPAASDITAALDGATATDACGPTTITNSDGPVNSDGCLRFQTRTFTARDGCGNTATIGRTVTWTADNTPPSIQTGGGSLSLGCNPAASDINNSLGTATATDACGTPTLSSSDGPVNSNGCGRSQTRSWTARDACGNTSTASRTVTWTADLTPPVFTGSYATTPLGCNPAASDITAALDGATATDACGPTTITNSDGPVNSDGCLRFQTRTFTARDGCGNTATIGRTVTWTSDNTPPVITTGGTGTSLGCNPAASDINNALGTATATDACGVPTLTSSDGSVTSDGCSRSQTRKWTARDACGNTSTASRTANWIADNTAPVFTNVPASVDLDCNVTVPGPGTATATDACGTPTVALIGNTDNALNCSGGFSREVKRTWRATDACGNTSTASQTIRVRCCPSVFCTYTQGQYGTEGGGGCDGAGNNLSTYGLISAGLSHWPGGTLVVGKPGRSITMSNNATDIACIIDVLPGNQGSDEIASGNFTICGLPASMLTNQHRIKNVLAGQTITLGINMGLNGQLGSFALQAGVLATQDLVGGCGSETPKTRVCHYNTLSPYNLTSVENQYTFRTFSPALIAAIPGTKNVTNLFELANRALGNTDGVDNYENGVSLDEIQQAVANINEGFDECMAFIGWNVAACPAIDPTPGDGRVAPTTVAPTLNVTAFPNPYQENFSLRVNSPVTGQASIGFYTIDGVKIGEMKRDVVANRDTWVPFNVPSVYRTRIVYTVGVGSYNAKGVVLSPNEPNPGPEPR